jgi:hypothetical protein
VIFVCFSTDGQIWVSDRVFSLIYREGAWHEGIPTAYELMEDYQVINNPALSLHLLNEARRHLRRRKVKVAEFEPPSLGSKLTDLDALGIDYPKSNLDAEKAKVQETTPSLDLRVRIAPGHGAHTNFVSRLDRRWRALAAKKKKAKLSASARFEIKGKARTIGEKSGDLIELSKKIDPPLEQED